MLCCYVVDVLNKYSSAKKMCCAYLYRVLNHILVNRHISFQLYMISGIVRCRFVYKLSDAQLSSLETFV